MAKRAAKGAPLRVGVIGVGSIAHQMHLPNWKELEREGRVKVTAVCDVIKERAQEMARTYEVDRVYFNHKKMLEQQEFDVIDICVHNRFHAPIAVDASAAGAHVLVEKPMAMSVAECEAMIRAAQKAKRKLMVAQHMRFEPAHEILKEVVESGELGQIYTANAVYLRRRGIPGWGKFHIKKESLGGPLIDIGVHVIDLATWLMGCPKPLAVSGKIWRKFGDRPDLVNCWGKPYPDKEFDVEDHGVAMVRFEGELVLIVETSWAANIPEERSNVSVLGDKAGISTNPLGVFGYKGRALTSRKFDWFPEGEGHRLEIRHFTECVECDTPVRVQPAESLRVQKIIDGIYESSRTNKEVRIQ